MAITLYISNYFAAFSYTTKNESDYIHMFHFLYGFCTVLCGCIPLTDSAATL